MFRVIILIFLLLLLITFLLLFVPINVIINYSENFSVCLKIFGIKLTLPFKTSKNKKVNKSGPSSFESSKKKKKSKNSFHFNTDIFKIGGESLLRILRGLHIKDFILSVKVSGNDAASTAVLFGNLSGIIYPFCGIIVSKMRPKNYSINVYPDFLGEKTSVYFNFHFSGKIFEVLKALLYFIREYNKIKKV